MKKTIIYLLFLTMLVQMPLVYANENSDMDNCTIINGETVLTGAEEQHQLNSALPSYLIQAKTSVLPDSWTPHLIFSDNFSYIANAENPNGVYLYADSETELRKASNNSDTTTDKWTRFTQDNVKRLKLDDVNWIVEMRNNTSKTPLIGKALDVSDNYIIVKYKVLTNGNKSYLHIRNSTNANTEEASCNVAYFDADMVYADDAKTDGEAIITDGWNDCVIILDYKDNIAVSIVNDKLLGVAQMFDHADTNSKRFFYFYDTFTQAQQYAYNDDYEIYSVNTLPDAMISCSAMDASHIKLTFNTLIGNLTAGDIVINDGIADCCVKGIEQGDDRHSFIVETEEKMNFSTQYNVSIIGNDVFGRAIAGSSFVTAERALKFQTQWAVSGQQLNGSVTVDNELTNPVMGILAAAAYTDDGKMKAFNTVPMEVTAESISEQPYNICLELPSDVTATDVTTTVFALDSLENICPLPVGAEQQPEFESTIDYENDMLRVRFHPTQEGTDIAVKLEMHDLETDSDRITYLALVSEDDGEICVPLESGDWRISVNTSSDCLYTDSGFYQTNSDLIDALTQLNSQNATKQTVVDVISDYHLNKIFNSAVYDLLDNASRFKVGADVLARKNAISTKQYDTINAFYRDVEDASFAMAFASQLSTEQLVQIPILYGSQLGISSKKAYAFYNDFSDSNRIEVCDYIKDKLSVKESYTMQDLQTAFCEGVVLTGIYRATTYLELTELLQLNQTDIGLDLSGYNAKEGEINRAILNHKYDSIYLLQKAINAAGKTGGGSVGGGGGGSSNVHKSGVSVGSLVMNEAPIQPQNPVGSEHVFSDISNFEWAKESIEYLSNRGIINGTGSDKFEPQRSVTREEFVKMLTAAFDVNSESNIVSFTDVKSDEWYYPCIIKAANAGIVNGDGNQFGIGSNITRQDMCVMLFRTMNIVGDETALKFNDWNELADYARHAVAALYTRGIVSGFENGSFMPNAFATRAEAAKLIYTAMKGEN